MGQLKLKRTNFKIGKQFKFAYWHHNYSLISKCYYWSFQYKFIALPFYNNNHVLKIEKMHREKGYIQLPIFEIHIF